MKINKKEIVCIIIIIIIQTAVYIFAGNSKQYIHMDEAYSYGLASYNKVEIQDNEDFYNKWHNKEYYEDYLTVNNNEVHTYGQVYENQKNDVHPPFYYLLLRLAMEFNLNSYSKWTGIILNIIIYAFITLFTYLITKKILYKYSKASQKALLVTLMSSLTLSSISNVIYIRMYALATLNILIITYLHLLLLDSKSINYKLLFLIGIATLIGVLTHYYYLFYLVMLFIMFIIKYIKEKRFKELTSYIITMGCTGILSIIIFPYLIHHMFFGYRGQGIISSMTNVFKYISNISLYILKINVYVFNNILFLISVVSIAIFIYKKVNKINIFNKNNKYIIFIAIPTLFYFILVAISSPWIELRYVMPICGMIFIIIMYLVIELLSNIVKQDMLNKIILIIALLMIIVPISLNQILKLTPLFDYTVEPETMYSNRKEIVEKLKNELNVPTVYMFSSNNNRFLDDILLFSMINESYIAKDIEYKEENIKNIFKNKNVSKGIVIFINEGQDNNKILQTVKNSINLKNIKHLKRLNSCDVYYIK